MKHFLRNFRIRISLSILLTATCLLLVAAFPTLATHSAVAASTPTLVVNANQVLRPVTHVASGGLYGLGSDTTPDDSMVTPLHPKDFVQMAPNGGQLPNGEVEPGGDALVVAAKAARAGATVTIRMPDYYPNFPYKWVSWSNWLSVVDGEIAARQAATNVTNINAWELWNEPDWTWDTTDAGSFNDGWVRTYQEVRSKDATTPIQGPSFSSYNASLMSSFLSNAKANNALPNIISWHELSGQGNIAADISAYRSLESSLGIGPLPIAIEEYGETGEVGVPGSLVGYIAKFERRGVDNAELAFWNMYGTFDDMVLNNTQPNGAWWLYKWYGDMTGNMLVTTPPAQTGLDGAASVNSAGNQVSVIFGGGSGANAVTINGLDALSAFGSSATVTLEYVNSLGRTIPVSGTTVLSVANYTISNGSITVPVNNMISTDGYRLIVTPTSTVNNYKIVNKNSGLVLGVTNASTASGAQALQWTDNGTADHLWQIVDAGNGYVKIVNKNSGLLLGITNASTASGAIALQWTDNGSADHLWQIVDAGNGYVKIVNKNSGLVLGVSNASTSAGALVLQWSDNGTADHLWQILDAGSSYVNISYDKIVNKNSGLLLGITNASTSAGAQALQWTDNGTLDHLWQIVDAGNGYVKIVNRNSGLYLGITDASTASGAVALQWTDNGTADHLWQLVDAGSGYDKIVNKNSGLVLGISSASTSAGALVIQASDSGTADQLWQIVQSENE